MKPPTPMFKVLKSEIRISKFETNPNDKNPKLETGVLNFEHFNFEFVSDFVLRASNLFRIQSLVIGIFQKNDLSPKTYHLKPHQRKSAGFSLVEVLVGAAVLIISVTGTLSIIAKNVSSAAIAAERVTAFYLAQEALEYVRGVRDNNAITNQNWLNGLDGSNGPNCFDNTCIIDVGATVSDPIPGGSGNPNAAACPGGSSPQCPALFLDDETGTDTGVYNHRDDGIATKFTREMAIEIIRAGEEVRVHATVRWMQGFVERSFTISGNIFNWR